MLNITELEKKTPILKEICAEEEVFWMNPDKTTCGEAMEQIALGMEDVDDCSIYYAMLPGNQGKGRNH